MGSSRTPPSVVQPPPLQDAFLVLEEELTSPELLVEKTGECSPSPSPPALEDLPDLSLILAPVCPYPPGPPQPQEWLPSSLRKPSPSKKRCLLPSTLLNRRKVSDSVPLPVALGALRFPSCVTPGKVTVQAFISSSLKLGTYYLFYKVRRF